MPINSGHCLATERTKEKKRVLPIELHLPPRTQKVGYPLRMYVHISSPIEGANFLFLLRNIILPVFQLENYLAAATPTTIFSFTTSSLFLPTPTTPGFPDGLFSNQNSKFVLILEGLRMENAGIFYRNLEYFAVIWYI
jgi:hypothetical protein